MGRLNHYHSAWVKDGDGLGHWVGVSREDIRYIDIKDDEKLEVHSLPNWFHIDSTNTLESLQTN